MSFCAGKAEIGVSARAIHAGAAARELRRWLLYLAYGRRHSKVQAGAREIVRDWEGLK
jgi:hypothetical protein